MVDEEYFNTDKQNLRVDNQYKWMSWNFKDFRDSFHNSRETFKPFKEQRRKFTLSFDGTLTDLPEL